jgi:hypothetical protein
MVTRTGLHRKSVTSAVKARLERSSYSGSRSLRLKSDDDGVVPAEVFRFSGGGVLALKGDAYPPTRNEDASKCLKLFLEFEGLLSKCSFILLGESNSYDVTPSTRWRTQPDIWKYRII